MMREQDQYMPIANVIRIMRRILPPHAKISDEAKETVQECVSEYISFITSEANQRCRQEQRKTVTADDVLWAMEKLGFDDYVGPLSVYLHRYRNGDGAGSSHYVPRGQQVLAPELAPAMPPPPPPSYYYGSGYPVGPSQMGPGAGSSSSGTGGPAYYDPYAHQRHDRF
ncbi:nuclear transcription factor Y subunit B-9-like [Prosopis cineraria]|uniref:nuclear transcription factor Y subunit B-9-like n=1 Tax=Prosopis cineraria TaxID=364024 RepID=UPI00240F7010|nr:nuclear transcription factor Y subunit B-9-like [Prosopis cineraria]